MGVDFYAYTVIGVKIDFESLRMLSKSTTVYGCSCGVASRDDKFCSQCGAKAWIVKKDQDEEQTLVAMCMEFGLNYMIDYDRGVTYVGEVGHSVHHEDSVPESCIPINFAEQGARIITDTYDAITKMCHQHNLGNLALMGIWTVMRISV